MKKWILLFVTISLSIYALAQNNHKVELRGHVYDANSKKGLSAASISCLAAEDSLNKGTTFTNENGVFIIDNLAAGNYFLYITYLGYKPMLLPTSIKSDSTNDIGNVYLQKSGVELSAIEIIGTKSPLRITKDTIEYNTSSYKIRKNSALEELLKKIPGVQIDENGTIKINGEIVKSILVDGRPFFSDQPLVSLKNLQADIIDKLQVLDRKTKERDPSSLSTAQTEKAINIIIKESKKRLWIGEFMLGYGSSERFASKLNFTKFNTHSQFAFFFNGDNTNGVQNGMQPTNGDLRKWNPNISFTKDITNRITSEFTYVIQDISQREQQNSSQQSYAGDTNYYYNQYRSQINQNTSHSFNESIKFKPDSLLTITLSSFYSHLSSNTENNSNQASYGSQTQLLDSGWIRNLENKKTNNISNSLSISKNFKKTGQNITISMSYANNNNNNLKYNISNTLYVNQSVEARWDTINQQEKIKIKKQLFQLCINYNFPIYTNTFLTASYGLIQYSDLLNKEVYGFDKLKNDYTITNDSLSSHFNSIINNQFGSIGIEKKGESSNFILSIFAMRPNLYNRDISSGNTINMSTITILPRAYFSYSLSDSKRLQLFLAGNQLLPTMDELQPIPDNSNPLFIRKGNPNIKPSATHDLSFSYSSFNTTKLRYFNLTLGAGFIINKIISSIWLDSLKRQIIEPKNVNGTFDVRFSIDNSFSLGKHRATVKTNTSFSFNRQPNYTNNIKVNTGNIRLSQSLSYNYSYKELFDFSLDGRINFYQVKYTDTGLGTINYISYNLSFDANINLPFGFIIGTHTNYALTTGQAIGYNPNTIILNASLSKSVFRSKAGIVKIQGFDLLNKNTIFERSLGANYIEDVKANTIQRFFLLSFTYLLKPKKQGGQ